MDDDLISLTVGGVITVVWVVLVLWFLMVAFGI